MSEKHCGHIQTTGLIGTPLSHSLSPVIHNAAAKALGLSWVYEALNCPDEASAAGVIENSRDAAGFVGMNVTMPYKELAAKAADDLDTSATRAGGANVLSMLQGRLIAYNTDGAGVIGALRRACAVEPDSANCLVCGTGPAARAALVALLDAGAARVALASRDLIRAQALREAYGDVRIVPVTYECVLGAMEESSVIIDATSVGMREGDVSVLPEEGFHAGQTLVDVVYAHGVTDIVASARRQGAAAFDGLGMLVEQAALSLEIWMRDSGLGEVLAPRDVMLAAASASACSHNSPRCPRKTSHT